MRQEQEERKTKELFQQLRQDDERRATSFISMWEAAMTRGEEAGSNRFAWRVAAACSGWAGGVAAAAVALALLGGSWLILPRRSAPTPPLALTPAPLVPAPLVVDAGPAPSPIKTPLRVSPVQTSLKRARQRRMPSQPLQTDLVISEWRSPTDFLLRTPGEQWLRTVPQFGGPRVEIKTIAPDQKN